MPEMLPPGSVIGILGGGQLGRMLALSAARLGLRAHIYAPEDDCPAAQACGLFTRGDYQDADKLAAFARSVDVVTYEFENVPAETVRLLAAAGAAVAPGERALAIAQDRLFEKQFIEGLGAEVAPYAPVDDLDGLAAAVARIGRPAILKTRRLGYDGKGQTALSTPGAALDAEWRAANEKAWREIGARPSILEGFVDFAMEISIIGARGRGGEVRLYDAPRNEHQGGILKRSHAPSGAPARAVAAAAAITTRLLDSLDYIGVVGVEFFVRRDGGIVVNEFAPRVHNSGHWTADACAVSQFEQHVRAVAGWPLGDPSRHSDCEMENLIGEDVERWPAIAREANACLHLYGKRDALAGRKMGHVTRLAPRR